MPRLLASTVPASGRATFRAPAAFSARAGFSALAAFVGCAAVGGLVASAVPAAAQAPTVSLLAGASIPASPDLANHWTLDLAGSANVAVPVYGPLSVRARVDYSRFRLDADAVPSSGVGAFVSSGTLSTLQLGVDVKVASGWGRDGIAVYGFGGGSFGRSDLSTPALAGSGAAIPLDTGSWNDFAISLGAGMDFPLGTIIGVVEAAYVVVLPEGEDVEYFTVRAGASVPF